MLLWILVVAQFLLAAVLVLSARWSTVPIVPLAVALPGILLAVWAWFKIGLRKVTIHPSATESTELATKGPYKIVRHPMYTGLLWFTAALLFDPFQLWRCIAWAALALVLAIKSGYEEQSMVKHFSAYSVYRDRTGRLIPTQWIFRRKDG